MLMFCIIRDLFLIMYNIYIVQVYDLLKDTCVSAMYTVDSYCVYIYTVNDEY